MWVHFPKIYRPSSGLFIQNIRTALITPLRSLHARTPLTYIYPPWSRLIFKRGRARGLCRQTRGVEYHSDYNIPNTIIIIIVINNNDNNDNNNSMSNDRVQCVRDVICIRSSEYHYYCRRRRRWRWTSRETSADETIIIF